MSAKLVDLPLTGHAPDNVCVAKNLRAWADRIEADDWGGVRTVVALIETLEGDLHRLTTGMPTDRARVTGLLSIAATRAATDD